MQFDSSMSLQKDQEVEVGYLECRRNHAVSIGKSAVDGCCEFMPAGEEGSGGYLRCAACSCHRSFHKMVVRLRWGTAVVDYDDRDFKPSTPK